MMIEWRLMKDHPDTENRYYGHGDEIDVIPEGSWLFCWGNGTVERMRTDEDLTPAEWPEPMLMEKPLYWAEINLPDGVK